MLILITQQTFVLMKTSGRRLEDVFHRFFSSEDVFKKLSRGLDQEEYIRHFLHVFRRHLQDVLFHANILKKSLKRLAKMSSRHLQDVFKLINKLNCFGYHVFNTSLRRFQHVFETHYEDGYLQNDLCPGHTSEKFMVGCKISKSELFGSIKTLKTVFF